MEQMPKYSWVSRFHLFYKIPVLKWLPSSVKNLCQSLKCLDVQTLKAK